MLKRPERYLGYEGEENLPTTLVISAAIEPIKGVWAEVTHYAVRTRLSWRFSPSTSQGGRSIHNEARSWTAQKYCLPPTDGGDSRRLPLDPLILVLRGRDYFAEISSVLGNNGSENEITRGT